MQVIASRAFIVLSFLAVVGCNSQTASENSAKDSASKTQKKEGNTSSNGQQLDTATYNRLMLYMANGDTTGRWPVKNAPLPLPGAILPFHRVVAYYGNLYSNRMGALGKWPKAEMIPKLLAEVKRWNELDTVIKSIPALHYIAVTAQGAAGKDGKLRYRMPHHQIDT
ncbi:MAG TPA: hypothetical protein VM871_09085, partial [Flavisolibacter sp.]|nr:hypothetical protein [Flavisolibacter sp.]